MDITVDKFMTSLSQNKKLFYPSVAKNRQNNQHLFDELGGLMIKWMANFYGEGYEEVLVESYASFVIDVNKSQMKYEKKGCYENKTYEDVFRTVYDNPAYMKLYHWGVFVSTFAWEHHLKIYNFYKNSFIEIIKTDKNTNPCVLELGSGSGIWSMLFVNHLNGWRAQGVDISETSVAFATKMSDANNLKDRVNYVQCDALKYSLNEKFDAGISCFLLEHLENPGELMINMANNIKIGGYAFVTAALTAAEVDHIFEFKRESEVVNLAEMAGFRVISYYSTAPTSYPREYNYLPRSMALIMQKRKNDIW